MCFQNTHAVPGFRTEPMLCPLKFPKRNILEKSHLSLDQIRSTHGRLCTSESSCPTITDPCPCASALAVSFFFDKHNVNSILQTSFQIHFGSPSNPPMKCWGASTIVIECPPACYAGPITFKDCRMAGLDGQEPPQQRQRSYRRLWIYCTIIGSVLYKRYQVRVTQI